MEKSKGNVAILSAKLDHRGIRGPQGLSAYEIAVNQGFKGTEDEWLASLGLNKDLSVKFEINNDIDNTSIPTTLAVKKFVNTYSFKNVEEMKKANLKIGDIIITNSYYDTEHTSGGATYLLRSKQDDDSIENLDTIFLDNNLIAELSAKTEINILQLGAKTDDNFDNTDVINYAIEHYKKIFIPAGTFKCRNIIINKEVELYGIYNASCLQAINDTQGNFIEMNISYTHIHDLVLDGDKIHNSNSLIALFTQRGNIDYHFLIQNLVIRNFTSHGIDMARGDNLVDNCYIHHNEGYGIYHRGSDNVFTNCNCAWNYEGGVRDQGASSRWVTCKCYVNGESYSTDLKPHNQLARGFRFSDSSKNLVINCEAQENYGDGFFISAYKNATFINCMADNNGLYNYKLYGEDENQFIKFYGFRVDNGENLTIQFHADNFRYNDFNSHTQYGSLNMNTASFNNMITIFAEHQVEDELYPDWERWKNLLNNNHVVYNNISWYHKIYGGLAIEKDKYNTSRLDFGKDEETSIKYRIATETDGSFRLYMYQNGTMIQNGNPIQVNSDGGAILGKSKIGFFGTVPVSQATAKSAATTIDETIALVNDLRANLIRLGLLK